MTVPISAPSRISSRSPSSKTSLGPFSVPFDVPSSASRFLPSLDQIGLPSTEPRSGPSNVSSNIATTSSSTVPLLLLSVILSCNPRKRPSDGPSDRPLSGPRISTFIVPSSPSVGYHLDLHDVKHH